MPILHFQAPLATVARADLIALYKECQPRILVVTDTLNFDPGQGFGLTQFVNTLKGSTIHGMTPKVVTASRIADPNADIPNFDFNDASKGLSISRYDVVFLFGARPEGLSDLPAPQVETIAKFMEAGGGVFATGDHQTLGASLCGNVPRVRAMRRWKAAQTPPHVSNTNRFSTNLSGPNEGEEFSDQSNTEPQRLYLNFRTQAGGVGSPHPLVQLKAPRRALEVYPDHPHEGECLVPASLGGNITVGGQSVPEWPNDLTGAALSPEIVAMSVSHGDGFPSGPTGPKDALMPRLFASIVAYDGHRANKGRVSTDSTWHHFININLDGTGEPGFNGLQSPAGVDTEALKRIREHYVNLATWLMPKKVRKCLRFPLVLEELTRFPLIEELELPPLKAATVADLTQAGGALLQSLSRRVAPWEVQAFVFDTLSDSLGEAEALKLLDQDDAATALRNQDIAQAAVGGLLTGVAARLAELSSVKEIVPHRTFEASAIEGTQVATKLALVRRRDQLKKMDELLSRLQSAGELR
ncbi:hypothetical protein [Aquabacterium parvum]|jgi:hypothetical protein|uniref:hypothetical protein n=1 Tax=Aquabacterium parvum TaxID=70584 RepID=UPI000718E76E|nr:hypothetical protein [Aquabacterium parvum]MBU0917568.1 hypothetical protein [Gammaproteobacteria bacterium]